MSPGSPSAMKRLQKLWRKDPRRWKTGGDRMTPAQASYLKGLCKTTGEQFDHTLDKARAARRIDELQQHVDRRRES
jgi:hypothetical protein